MSRTSMALLLAAALAGCGGAKRAATIRQAPLALPMEQESAPREAPGPTARAPRLRPPCDILREVVASAGVSFPEKVAPKLAPCFDGKGGAYSMMTTYIGEAVNAETHGGGYVGQLVLLHATANGRIAQSAPFDIEDSVLESEDWTLEGVADFDADGVDELMTTRVLSQREAKGSSEARVWQVTGERIESYAAAEELYFQRFRDVDDDGVPDLELATPFSGNINSCGPDGEWIEFGPKLVAHANAGRFVLDVVSEQEVLRLCPERPRSLVPRVRGGVDNTELRRRLACAVMWGTPSDVIVRELERQCPVPPGPPKPDWQNCDFEGVLPECVNLRQLFVWASVTPPFVLH
jgi:hypothetical protein